MLCNYTGVTVALCADVRQGAVGLRTIGDHPRAGLNR
jgi:hypothetical protein